MQEFIIPKIRLRLNYVQKENSEIYSYAKQRGIYFKRCGKLIVASNPSEEKVLLKIQQNASENGILLKYKDKKIKKN